MLSVLPVPVPWAFPAVAVNHCDVVCATLSGITAMHVTVAATVTTLYLFVPNAAPASSSLLAAPSNAVMPTGCPGNGFGPSPGTPPHPMDLGMAAALIDRVEGTSGAARFRSASRHRRDGTAGGLRVQ